MNEFKRSQPSRLSLRLSTLLLLLTICAILVAWFVDHRKLRAQIEPPPPKDKISMIYRLSNASSDLVAQKLAALYPEQHFLPGTTAILPGASQQQAAKSVVVRIDVNLRDQIDIMMEYFDRQGTNLAENAKVAENLQHLNNTNR